MSAELTQDPQLARQAEANREVSEPSTDRPYDDGEPLESNRHRIAMNVLIDSVHTAFADRDDYLAGGNMFLYDSENQAMNQAFRGPDFFVTLGVDWAARSASIGRFERSRDVTRCHRRVDVVQYAAGGFDR